MAPRACVTTSLSLTLMMLTLDGAAFQSLLQMQGDQRVGFFVVMSGKVLESQPVLMNPSHSRLVSATAAPQNEVCSSCHYATRLLCAPICRPSHARCVCSWRCVAAAATLSRWTWTSVCGARTRSLATRCLFPASARISPTFAHVCRMPFVSLSLLPCSGSSPSLLARADEACEVLEVTADTIAEFFSVRVCVRASGFRDWDVRVSVLLRCVRRCDRSTRR